MKKMKTKLLAGILMAVVFVAAGDASAGLIFKTPFEKLRAKLEGEYFKSKKVDGKIIFMPLHTSVEAVKGTLGDMKMVTMASKAVTSVTIHMGLVSVAIDPHKFGSDLSVEDLCSSMIPDMPQKQCHNEFYAVALAKLAKGEVEIDFEDEKLFNASSEEREFGNKINEMKRLVEAKKFDEALKTLSAATKEYFHHVGYNGFIARNMCFSESSIYSLQGKKELATETKARCEKIKF